MVANVIACGTKYKSYYRSIHNNHKRGHEPFQVVTHLRYDLYLHDGRGLLYLE
jgi:hypothetical protein